MSKKILITGASGFIGSRLIIKSILKGHEVIATSRKTSKSLEKELSTNIFSLDLLDKKQTEEFNQPVETIVHTATANDIVSKDLFKGINLSVNGTINLLELANRLKIKNIIFISTLQVYGQELEGIYSENSPLNCQSPYALNHFLGEEICKYYFKNKGLNVLILRPSNVFGVPDSKSTDRSTLVPICFVKEIMASEKINMKSSGKQMRNFISNNQLSDIILSLIDAFPKGLNYINAVSNYNEEIRKVAELTKEIYFNIFQKKTSINFLSNTPVKGNEFIIKSSVDKKQIKDSKKELSETIEVLFKLLEEK